MLKYTSAIRQHGKEITLRGSNKKYYKLDDLDWLYEQLKTKSMGQLAKELKVPYNSIRHRVARYFSPAWLENIVFERKPHRKKKTMDVYRPGRFV